MYLKVLSLSLRTFEGLIRISDQFELQRFQRFSNGGNESVASLSQQIMEETASLAFAFNCLIELLDPLAGRLLVPLDLLC